MEEKISYDQVHHLLNNFLNKEIEKQKQFNENVNEKIEQQTKEIVAKIEDKNQEKINENIPTKLFDIKNALQDIIEKYKDDLKLIFGINYNDFVNLVKEY